MSKYKIQVNGVKQYRVVRYYGFPDDLVAPFSGTFTDIREAKEFIKSLEEGDKIRELVNAWEDVVE